MSPCRLCVITFDWYPSEPRVHRLSETAVTAGHQVDVICLLQPGEPSFETRNGVNIYRLPASRHYAGSVPELLLSWLRFLLLATIKATSLHHKHRYELVHVHNIPDFLVFSALFPRFSGAKVILDVQDVTPELMTIKATGYRRALLRRLAIWQERLSTAFADHVVTVGWPFEELLLQRGVPSKKITIILNSAYPPLFPAAQRPPLPGSDVAEEEQTFILMYHGTVVERYGLDTALRAVALALPSIPRLHFKIRGAANPQYSVFLQKLVSELGISEHITFIEPTPYLDTIVDFIVHGDVGIIPYRNDTFADLVLPTKAYEFAWMQRPMIASNTRAMRSMFRAESVAFCDPSKPESFAEAIIDLYRHPEKRASMIMHASQDYEPYRWERMAERYEQLLMQLSGRQQMTAVEQPSLASRDVMT
ncbi:glycosyltransferase family 4 protein [Ktedonosporobacter rubrisoli]|nr:glycosyltransferase family 4 protein [Ktedonosporobacter rubrisoli]